MGIVDPPNLTKFQQKLAEHQAKLKAQKPPAEIHDTDLVPEKPYKLTPEQEAINAAVEHIDILDAYIKYCGKMVPAVKPGQREGIQISCPIPGHVDADPSAWINLDKQTWYCGGCAIGGDIHDLAAYSKGYPVPGYKDSENFPKLRKEMADDFGYVPFTSSSGVDVPIVPDKEPAKVTEEDEYDPIELYPTDEPDEIESNVPVLPFDQILVPDSFLDIYLRQTRVSDIAQEFHFFNALIGLGFALGRNVTLFDSFPVYGNLFICTLGRTGSGKSQAVTHLRRLLRHAVPHNWDDPNSRGVVDINSPGSAEALIKQFQKEERDPTNPKIVARYLPVSGLITFNELSSLIGRANRTGSVLKPTLMQFYDMEYTVSTFSLTSGTKTAERPFASTFTSSQPAVLKDLLAKSDEDSGFLNRWLFVAGRPKIRVAIGGTKVDILPAGKPLEDILAWSSIPFEIQWTEEAAKLYTDFFHDRIEKDKERTNDDLIARVDLLTKKLILLFTANKKEKFVTSETVRSVIDCYEYILYTYSIVGTSLVRLTHQRDCEEVIIRTLLNHSRRATTGITIRDIVVFNSKRGFSYEQYRRAIETLKTENILKEYPKITASGRIQTVRYKHVKYAKG